MIEFDPNEHRGAELVAVTIAIAIGIGLLIFGFLISHL
jgi:hypothetical protein